MAKFNPKIYLKDSDKVRLADWRVRIVREHNPRRPDEHEDLVFEVTDNPDNVPSDVLKTWKFERRNLTFFTTAERCKKMVSPDPSYWTSEKLDYFAEVEKKIWEDWYYGYVYGCIVEHWDAKRREWMTTSSLWGMYGKQDLLDNLATETDGINIPICVDEEEMKYEFDNVEHKPNEFD